MGATEAVITDLRRRVADAASVVVFTGAGMSAESGVPTYRGQGGLWKNFRAQDLATLDAFQRNPALVWGWYRERRNRLLEVEPNDGHRAIALAAGRVHLTLATQNVDGLHAFAGSVNFLELHGNIWREQCLSCPTTDDRSRHWLEKVTQGEADPLPLCPDCASLMRPSVVWFGEALDGRVIEAAFRAAEGCDLMFVVGTSGEVQPAASLPVLARRAGAYVVEVNIEPTLLTERCNVSLFEPAGRVLPKILA
ncbi:MAG TPA: NAD-dependent deacylase [bacterium]|nr:NAD-dependent deacylase [bacterium]